MPGHDDHPDLGAEGPRPRDTPIGNRPNAGPRISVPGADKYFRALRRLSIGFGLGNAFHDMHRLGRSPRRAASLHIRVTRRFLASAPAKVPGALPRCRSGRRGSLMKNNTAVATPSFLPRTRTRERSPG